jgi:RPA family protein
MAEFKKRETAYKLRIGEILSGTPIVEDIPQEIPNPAENQNQVVKERFRFLELGDKKIIRVNVIANVIEKFSTDSEKRYSTLTVDDGTGQIRIKAFGEAVDLFNDLVQGDTIIIIGVLRSYNQEIYISPEIIKKCDPRYLFVRKLELEKALGKPSMHSSQQIAGQSTLGGEKKLSTREQIIELIKNNSDGSGASTEEIILKIKDAPPEVINSEIIKLVEDGLVYEPRPSRVRWLG